jgi:SAM-dependent methyltransferase
LATDYSSVTEVTGTPITREALAMMWTRYAVAADYCAAKDVLEVGCGSAQGLGPIAATARFVVGGDYTESLTRAAQLHYQDRVHFVTLDGQRLPFKDASFDVIMLYEAIYYLADPGAFLAECRRVLRPGGTVLLCSANREWDGFNPSPYSHGYFSAAELGMMLREHGFDVRLFGAYPDDGGGAVRKAVRLIRQVAVRFHLIPKTMAGKALLKRLFYGKLATLGPELAADGVERAPLEPLAPAGSAAGYKVIYAVGSLPSR